MPKTITPNNICSLRTLLQDSTPDQEPCCAYCRVSDRSLIQCSYKGCNRRFCNNKLGLDRSHIGNHLLNSKHNRLSIPTGVLQCAKCHNDNIFKLSVIKDNGIPLQLCTHDCMFKEEYAWCNPRGLIVRKKYKLSLNVVLTSKARDLRSIKPPSQGKVDRLEQEWKSTQLSLKTIKELTQQSISNKNSVQNIEKYNAINKHIDSTSPVTKIQEVTRKLPLLDSTLENMDTIIWTEVLQEGESKILEYVTSQDSWTKAEEVYRNHLRSSVTEKNVETYEDYKSPDECPSSLYSLLETEEAFQKKFAESIIEENRGPLIDNDKKNLNKDIPKRFSLNKN